MTRLLDWHSPEDRLRSRLGQSGRARPASARFKRVFAVVIGRRTEPAELFKISPQAQWVIESLVPMTLLCAVVRSCASVVFRLRQLSRGFRAFRADRRGPQRVELCHSPEGALSSHTTDPFTGRLPTGPGPRPNPSSPKGSWLSLQVRGIRLFRPRFRPKEFRSLRPISANSSPSGTPSASASRSSKSTVGFSTLRSMPPR